MIFAEDSNNEQSEFDTIVGCIEDIVIGEKFQDLQVFISNIFMSITQKQIIVREITKLNGMVVFQESLIGSNCEEFDENSEENKLIYMDIFQVIIATHYLHN